jgi:hypothetical protein
LRECIAFLKRKNLFLEGRVMFRGLGGAHTVKGVVFTQHLFGVVIIE